MSRLSSKSSLLAGVSAVVLATSVGVSVGSSGALAADIDARIGFNVGQGSNQSINDVWAQTDSVTADSYVDPDVPSGRRALHLARSGDDLFLNGNTSAQINEKSRASDRTIGILTFEGNVGTASFSVSGAGVTATIGEIKRTGSQAVDLKVGDRGANIQSSATLKVTGNAVIRNLTIDMTQTQQAGFAKAVFEGNLTTHGAIQINAGATNNVTDGGGVLNATLELKGATTTLGGDVTLNDEHTNKTGSSLVVSGVDGDQTIGGTGQIKAAQGGEGEIRVLNGREGQAPRKAEFDVQIGTGGSSAVRLRQLTVGDATKGGHAVFTKGVHVDNIEVIAGNHTNEKATAEFRGDVSGTTMTLKDGDVSGGTIPQATVIFNARDNDITVNTKIIADESFDGVLRVVGGLNGNQVRKVTFEKEIGTGTDNRPLGLSVGLNGDSVAAGDKSGGVAVFEEDVSFFNLNVRGGNAAAEDSNATIEKSLTAKVTLYDYGEATATLTIGGSGRADDTNDMGQTITGTIDGGGNGQGTLIC